jgi:hypothetical protein
MVSPACTRWKGRLVDDDPLLEVESVVLATAKSGFPHEMSLAQGYELSGPLVGVGAALLAPPPPIEPVLVGVDDVTQLVQDLNRRDHQWAAAVVDDTIVLANNRAGGYIPAGIHLPYNVRMVHGAPDDELFWRVYGWPPAERLVAYAQHYGVLDQITTLVAQRDSRQTITTAWEVMTHSADPFAWVRPTLGTRPVELIELKSNDPPRSDDLPRWGSARRGHHRLELVHPDRYGELARQVDAGELSVEHVLEAAAESTVAAAKVVLTHRQHVFAESRDNPFSDGERLQVAILESVAATNAHDIASRRSNPHAIAHSLAPDHGMGMPADYAPAWAHRVDSAYNAAKRRAESQAITYYAAARYDHDASVDDLNKYLISYANAELVAIALEAVLLWSADPLPVADVDYAARSITGDWDLP